MAIVVIDDSPTALLVLEHFVKVDDLAIKAFSSPLDAEAYLEVNGAELVIVDFAMPFMNGIEFVEGLRAQAKTRHTPVLMVTSRSDETTRRRALNAGVTEFLTKPVDPITLKRRIAALIQAGNEVTASCA